MTFYQEFLRRSVDTDTQEEKVMSSQMSADEKVKAIEGLIREHEEAVRTEILAVRTARESDNSLLNRVRLEGQLLSKMASLNSDLVLGIRGIVVPNFEVVAEATA